MERSFDRRGSHGSDIAAAVDVDDGGRDTATGHWLRADHRHQQHTFSNDRKQRIRPPQLDRMHISNLITEQSGSDDEHSNPDTVPHLDADTSTSTVDTEDGTNMDHDDNDADDADDALQLHHARLLRSRQSSSMTSTLHGLCCSKADLIHDADRTLPHHRRGRSLLSHHACLHCRQAHKRCIPHHNGDGSGNGCARCRRHGFACEIVVEDLPLWSSKSRQTLLPRLVRVRGFDGQGGGMGVRFVPVCRCPLRILD